MTNSSLYILRNEFQDAAFVLYTNYFQKNWLTIYFRDEEVYNNNYCHENNRKHTSNKICLSGMKKIIACLNGIWVNLLHR